jgi:hypothetical protein
MAAMTNDTSNPRRGVAPNWTLPEVLAIKMRRIPFEPPKRRNFQSSFARYTEAVEFIVDTAAPIPSRAESPALFIGGAAVTEGGALGPTRYRFLAFELERLKPGSRIAFGWANDPVHARKQTMFVFELTKKE